LATMRARGPNERLRRAMARAGYTVESLAEASGFHPKQVGRWLAEGVVPRRTGAKALVADLLDVNEDDIWPLTATNVQIEPEPATADLIEVWAHRADVPKARWWGLLSGARRHIDLLADDLSFLRQDHPGLDQLLGEKVAAGCQVRVVLPDPASRHVRDRDGEQQMDGQLGKLILRDLKALRDQPLLRGIDLRTSVQCLYTSLFRADDNLFSSPHLFGLPGWATPVYHLRRHREGGLFDAQVGHFDRVWSLSEPVSSRWPAGPTERHLAWRRRAWGPVPGSLPSSTH
jgi:hypothetical protein